MRVPINFLDTCLVVETATLRIMPINSVTTAVFPVAGVGISMMPATKALPRELLPVLDQPIIESV